MYLSDVYTLPASLAGVPAMSVPCAPTKSGLPVGLQIIARPLDEATMLAVAAACEADFPCAIAPLTTGDVSARGRALFEASGCACFCRCWHFEGNKNDGSRAAFERARSATGTSRPRSSRAGAPEGRGLLALEGDDSRSAG